jgi:multicomponent Na+:H+ antiporter subunit G
MSALLLNWLSGALILAGSAFVVIGAVGIVRMPDLYTRMHAASVTETLGAGLLFGGLMLQSGLSLVTLKLFFLLALFFFTGPLAAHALAQAALHENVEPLLHEDRRKRSSGSDRPEGAG